MKTYEKNNITDIFIISRSNKRAFEQCFNVVSNKGAHGSILFVYGPSPSGKTQLLKTTAKQYLDEHGERPCEVTFNQLINDLVAEIKNEETKLFAKKATINLLILAVMAILIVFFTEIIWWNDISDMFTWM